MPKHKATKQMTDLGYSTPKPTAQPSSQPMKFYQNYPKLGQTLLAKGISTHLKIVLRQRINRKVSQVFSPSPNLKHVSKTKTNNYTFFFFFWSF